MGSQSGPRREQMVQPKPLFIDGFNAMALAAVRTVSLTTVLISPHEGAAVGSE